MLLFLETAEGTMEFVHYIKRCVGGGEGGFPMKETPETTGWGRGEKGEMRQKDKGLHHNVSNLLL